MRLFECLVSYKEKYGTTFSSKGVVFSPCSPYRGMICILEQVDGEDLLFEDMKAFLKQREFSFPSEDWREVITDIQEVGEILEMEVLTI